MSGKILVGFTGGLRSSVLSVLLKEQGYEVSGLYLDFSDFAHPLWSSACASVANPKELRQARENAEKLGIALQVVSGGGLFEQKVVDPTLHAALMRREEHPALLFHSQLLLPVLHQVAAEYDCESWATGHRVITQGRDLMRSEQSHLVAFSAHEVLKSGIFPLGSFQEQHLSKLGLQLGLTLESTAVCGHPAQSNSELWQAWVQPRLPTEFTQRGWVRHPQISTGIAEHPGIFGYPVGTSIPASSISKSATRSDEDHSQLIAVDYELTSQTLWAMLPEQTERRSLTLEEVQWWEANVNPLGDQIEIVICSSDGSTRSARARIQFQNVRTARLELQSPCTHLFLGTRILFVMNDRIVGHARVSSALPLGELTP